MHVRLKKKVKAGVNVVVCVEDGTWVVAKVVCEPRAARAGEKDHNGESMKVGESDLVLIFSKGVCGARLAPGQCKLGGHEVQALAYKE